MFDALSDRFDVIFTKLRKRGKINEKDLKEVSREIRLALLEADVNFQVVKRFVTRVEQRAIDAKVHTSLTPAQQIIKIVHDELVETLGGTTGKLTMSPKPPTVILLAGLQGSGKTTQAGKLAKWLKSQGHDCLLVGADLQRPAAVQQLRVLGERVGVPVFSEPSDPVTVARKGMEEAARLGKPIVIVDTAGRLQIDTELMNELVAVRDAVQPHNVLLVIDAMTGQEAVNVAEAFHAAVPIDGVILTKIDGDARGGAALSVKEVIGRPILFAGTGEKLDEFEPFHPDRLAQRILGMGDMLTMIEKAEQVFDVEQAAKAEERLRKGQFTLEDFMEQLQAVKKMGSLSSIIKMIPGLPKEARNAEINDGELKKVEAIIRSMTPAERRSPQLINGSRRLRIAKGSGTQTQDVNKLLKEFQQMQKMMKSMGAMAGGKRRGMPGLPGLPGLGAGGGGGGGFPGGGFPGSPRR